MEKTQMKKAGTGKRKADPVNEGSVKKRKKSGVEEAPVKTGSKKSSTEETPEKSGSKTPRSEEAKAKTSSKKPCSEEEKAKTGSKTTNKKETVKSTAKGKSTAAGSKGVVQEKSITPKNRAGKTSA